MSHSILMPLVNSPFALGEAQRCAESFADPDERAIAMAELAYFQGRPEDAAALSRPYLEAPDVALRSSACFIFAYASLPLGQVAQTRYALDVLEHQAQAASEKDRPAAVFARDAAFSLLHLDVPDALAANDLSRQSLMPRLGEGVKLFLSYVQAHQAYLAGDYAYSLGIAEGALGMATALRPIPTLYLHLVCCMDAMSLKKVAYAKELFHRAWSLAAPDGLIQGLADCIAARELIKIKVLENSEYSAREAADALCEALGCECVQVIGRKFVLFKQKKKESAFDAILAK